MSGGPIKFLLVDDVEENLTALDALLRRDGLELIKARSAAQALEVLLVHEVALAILDVQMPEMNGFELAELMRGTARTKTVPIIFVTAGARDPQRVFKGYESGAVDFLFKPIEPHILKSKAEVFFELHRQQRELANALRFNEMFMGILGHDLRNPLSAMTSGAQLLGRQLADEGQQRTLRRMLTAAQRMSGMIDQLLDLTRARMAGGVGFVRSRQPVDVAQLVRQAIDELRVAHPSRPIVMTASGDGRTTGDADRLLQVFSNLIANAITHGTAACPIVVTVEGGDDDIAVAVHNGGAIPADVLPTIFDPFRGRGVRASSGLGLGLYIARQIATAHGGNVTGQSGEAGTTFTVTIPRREAMATADVAREAGSPEARADSATAGAKARILIVEDDSDVREVLLDLLHHEGYRAMAAGDGAAALRTLETEPRPDLILLDLTMPVLDGAGFRERQLRRPPIASIPVVVVSADPNGAEHAARLQAAGFLKKPVNIDALLGMVERLTGRMRPAAGMTA